MTDIFTTEELATLSAQVDEQLSLLREKAITFGTVKAEQPDEKLLEKQRQFICNFKITG
jgi:hypothetical protein